MLPEYRVELSSAGYECVCVGLELITVVPSPKVYLYWYVAPVQLLEAVPAVKVNAVPPGAVLGGAVMALMVTVSTCSAAPRS
jgi:hypothetical protein